MDPSVKNLREWVLLLFVLFCVLSIAGVQYGSGLADGASPTTRTTPRRSVPTTRGWPAQPCATTHAEPQGWEPAWVTLPRWALRRFAATMTAAQPENLMRPAP